MNFSDEVVQPIGGNGCGNGCENTCYSGTGQSFTCPLGTRYFPRAHPNGDLSQRFPYDTFRFYYYDRPYNSFQIDGRRQEFLLQSDSRQLPYNRQVFRDVYQQMQHQILNSRFLEHGDLGADWIESDDEQISRDGNFEFVDWRTHFQARRSWNQKEMQVQAEQGLEPPESPIIQPAKQPLDHER